MKSFDIPGHYRSPLISRIKEARKLQDPRKKDFDPTLLDFGPVQFYLARHFGFCYGVENAIERAYRAIADNPGRRIFLLSQMIHNPAVNKDLEDNGIRFLMDTEGHHIFDWDELRTDDILLIPAFGTTLEIERTLRDKGIDIETYNTTCPFVEKVWNRSEKLAEDNCTIIIHGKPRHEETRATFSHASAKGSSIVVKDIEESRELARFILDDRNEKEFFDRFEGRCSQGFRYPQDLEKVGVVNQTTMLASETQEIADFFKQVMLQKYGEADLRAHFADTRDTLCYATNDNQQATYALLETNADLAIVVGGYNSSNTSHIADLLETRYPTYFIKDADEILSQSCIRHYDYHHKQLLETPDFLPSKRPVKIVLTSGASCPDAVLNAVLEKLMSMFPGIRSQEEVVEGVLQ